MAKPKQVEREPAGGVALADRPQGGSAGSPQAQPLQGSGAPATAQPVQGMAPAQGNGAVAVQQPAQLPSELMQELQGDASKGVSTLARDNIIPMIYVLQPLSPQVQERRPEVYIEGAKAGHFWLRNSPVQLVGGDVGMAFQPCHFKRDAVEWIPRDLGGGFVARYDFASPDESMDDMAKRLNLRVEPSEKKSRPPRYWNGDNEVKETRYHAGFVHGGMLGLQDYAGLVLPFVIPFGGTGHGVSRAWMTSMGQHTIGELAQAMKQQVPPNGTAPTFSGARLYKLTTKWRKNASGEWATVFVEDTLGWVPGLVAGDMTEYRRGRQLHDAMVRGEKVIESPVEQEDEGGGGESVDAAAERAGV